MNNNKNILLAMALCAATFFVWQYFVANPAMKAEQARQAHLVHQEKTRSGGGKIHERSGVFALPPGYIEYEPIQGVE